MKHRIHFFNRQFKFFLFLLTFTFLFTSCVKEGDLLIQRGAKFYSQQNFQEAEKCFLNALETECSYSPEVIYIYIANCYSQRREYDTALEWRFKSLEIVKDLDNINNIAMIYRLKKEDSTAEKYYREAIEFAPENYVAYVSLGALFMTAERIDDAIPLLEKAEELDSSVPIVHADLAVCYAKKGRFDDAESEYNVAVELKAEYLTQFRKQIDELENNSSLNSAK